MKLKNKNGVWAFALLLVSSVLGLVMSCTMGIGDTKPYLYGRKGGDTPPDLPTPIEEPDIPIVPGAKDPLKDGEHNKIDYNFNGSNIDDYIFKASFDKQKVPTYKLEKIDGKSWKEGDKNRSEFIYDGSKDGNTVEGGSYTISPAYFYRYNGYNPLSGAVGERMKRFRFYALLKSTAVIASMNQYLIAVDTHSKFVFAYGKITETSRQITGDLLPTKFGPVENFGEKKRFYEYDPIGFLSENGGKITITLYNEYQDEMRKSATEFFPSVHDPSREIAKQENANTPGCSPYYVKPVGSKVIKVSVSAKSVKNVNMVSKDIGVFTSSSRDTAYFINVLRAAVYLQGAEPKYEKLLMTANQYEQYGGVTAIGSGYTIKPGETQSYTDKNKDFAPILMEEGKDVFVNLDTRIWLYGVRNGVFSYFIETATDPVKLSDYDSPVVKFKYYKESDSLKLYGVPNGVTISGGNDWSVPNGQKKDITLVLEKDAESYYVNGNGSTAKCEVTYEIKFDIVE